MSIEKKERVILGIDPGTSVMGYGVICENGSKNTLQSLGIVKLDHLNDHFSKLRLIFEKTVGLIDAYHPDVLAIEAPFYGKNIQVLLKLGRAQGIAMAAALSRDIPVFEYAPRKIKQSITGNGNATKEQVAAMLQRLLNFKETPEFLDATDGLAVALCHAFQRTPTSSSSSKSYAGWSGFVRDNKSRLK
ncbi:crossover junction endodeoxyribonuclease RuvC [Pedobacter sp. SYP-B3415]|uniref:crossover junction endodeoxyribonuclease RuvC n=1 Tax=Pedobacter sp. SYP-B3415 TaxID=2496641 RepID=UPI00101CB10B|nr:crossover junction endodeoxyribonuclease RuvC [Pedobacter sp. SYP-B3415]